MHRRRTNTAVEGKAAVNEEHVRSWVERYVAAWTSNDPAAIGALFAEDATYRFDPAGEPTVGRDAIVSAWIDSQDEPGTWRAQLEPLAVTDDVAVVSGTVDYDNGNAYSNLWVIRLGVDGAATDFTEWYMPRNAAPE